ncbi:RNA polymerase-associated protein RapA [Alteromonadaceae bacterium M269]|nr:RNA polymerase-associated protein RapA [Alteromonadaceae bacterium M269]
MQQKNLYAVGQRWLSNTEPDLGLGIIVDTQGRALTILFPATGEQRSYAADSSPLTRITFDIGETITSVDGWKMVVEEKEEAENIISYVGQRIDTQEKERLLETRLDHHYQMDDPEQRFFQQQLDHPKWFDLRSECLQFQHQHQTSPLLGLVGARVDLIPHQLNIANQVGQRFAPRVLLADEVGLGKTIEAALIIHQQLLTGRAQRVLIVVPSSLVHQWLVEMLRRVNLAFSIFDEERCEALSSEQENPFESEQLVLCSLDFLTHNSRYFEQATQAHWDLMIVDEAHHLTWSPGQPSQEYQVVETLARLTKGVLLLTATPDQLGHESHFARLRLLDPNRFYDYDAFIKEEQQYTQLAQTIRPLLEEQTLSNEQLADLNNLLDEAVTADSLASEENKKSLIDELIDRHGTGRLLFRNSRSSVSGFPKRKLHAYPLAQPEIYNSLLDDSSLTLKQKLHPESHPNVINDWLVQDTRIEWFLSLLNELKGKKVLTICSSASTAMQLADYFKQKHALRCTLFHEGMSIVERDKAANYFAQSEDGAQLLICSEIGSEGRNFQFAHHLVLLDLPMIPDLLEQRIGRLDRIGQTEQVNIHVPFFENSAQQLLLDWYHQGLNAFEQTCPTGTTVYTEVEELLLSALDSGADAEQSIRDELIAQTATLHQQLKRKLESGRDKLLELNSSGKGKITDLLTDIQASDDSPTLERFMTRLFDAIGVLQEEKDDSCYVLRPTESMISQLPGMGEEGTTITYERSTAIQLENVQFFSWDHPMLQHAFDMILTEPLGKASVALSNNKQLPQGSYWLECLFEVSATARPELQLKRFLPPTPFTIRVNSQGQQVDKPWLSVSTVNPKMATQLIQALEKQIKQAIEAAQKFAIQRATKLRSQTHSQMTSLLSGELNRMKHLSELNPSVRQEEITYLQNQIEELSVLINDSKLSLQAIRLVVNSH